MAATNDTILIDEMVATLPRNEQVVVNRLRTLVKECIPKAAEKAYIGHVMPFYTHRKLICFIWPPSVDWNDNIRLEKQKAKGVALGFNQGDLMANEDNLLLSEGRKKVLMTYYRVLSDIDEHRVRAWLFEAAMIDEQFSIKSKRPH